MVKWGSTLNTCVHAYETKINLSMEDFQNLYILCILYISCSFVHRNKIVNNSSSGS